MKSLIAIPMTVLILTTGPALADCGVAERLQDQRRSLDRTIGVSKRDRAFIQSFGITFQTNKRGATYIQRSDLLAALETSNCNDDLRRWTENKANYPNSSDR